MFLSPTKEPSTQTKSIRRLRNLCVLTSRYLLICPTLKEAFYVLEKVSNGIVIASPSTLQSIRGGGGNKKKLQILSEMARKLAK